MSINKKIKIVKELLSGNLSLERRQEVSDWDAVKKQLNSQWEQSGKQIVDYKIKKRIWENINKRCNSGNIHQVHIELWKVVAACASIILIIGSLWYTSNNSRYLENEFIEITATRNQTYMLPDSSKVWMEPGSKLKYYKAFNKDRSIWLSGNSLFEVYKHRGSTFRVHIENAFIEVKGTTFRIEQNNPNENYITLFNGEIEFNIESTNEKIAMKPLQKLTYHPQNTNTHINDIPNINWKNGRFYFKDIPLDEFIEIINHMNDSNIILGPGVKKNSVFSGSIRFDESIDEIAEKICFSLNLKKKEKIENNLIIHN